MKQRITEMLTTREAMNADHFADGIDRIAPTPEMTEREFVKAIGATYSDRERNQIGTAGHYWWYVAYAAVYAATDTRSASQRMAAFHSGLGAGEAAADTYR